MDTSRLKFKEMPYTRPDVDTAKEEIRKVTGRFTEAGNYAEAKEAFLALERIRTILDTQATLAYIRHTIDTRDSFYDAEETFWNSTNPELEEYYQAFTDVMLKSPFRADLEKEFGEIVFINAEIARKSFDPEVIPQMQQENDLAMEYEKLIASAQIPFEGGVYTLSQMTPFKNDPDDARRLAAWKAEGQWYKEQQARLDEIYDKLTHLRDEIGRRLGYEGYTQLGYYRMGRNCYTKEDVEKFRDAVVKYVVPVADKIFRRQAQRLGKEYPMSFADNVLEFRSGNPKPSGDAQAVLDAGSKFYRELSPETDEFFRTLRERELMDVLSTEGKAGGGYCTEIPEYHVPFIFANFNGTQGDVEVVTHEAGHAFEAWMNRFRIPKSTVWPTMEACEVHSMSMEFFGEEWAEDFFGADAAKFRYSHLAGALTFIPYGTMVDHFQHSVFEHPEFTPAQRHAEWKRLLGIYMPWQRLDGEIPFYSEGEGWQRQHHIYELPFYYIDYCLAQTVSLQFWSLIRKDREKAWKTYMDYTVQGGGDTFTNMLGKAGLDSPFEEQCLRDVCAEAEAYLDAYDLTGIE